MLNIYPTNEVPNANGVDIAGKRLKKSAMLEGWIEEYGKDVIKVASLNKEDFEANPNLWLKDSNGEYKYDVIAIGFWNILKVEHHLNDVGVRAIDEFIESGRGVLAGHHHLGEPALGPDGYVMDIGLNKIRDKFNIEIFAEQNHYYDSNLPGIDFVLGPANYSPEYISDSKYVFIGTKLKAIKKGSLLNYPHKISDADTTFVAPESHHCFVFNKGDTWFNYADETGYIRPWDNPKKGSYIKESPKTKELGTNNSYLTTWNNTAIIQTGHANGAATPDEQKILANTLFYLNQVSTDNFLDDHSGQDIMAPDKPSILNQTVSKDTTTIHLNATKDNASAYQYYVEAESKNGDTVRSKTVDASIETGFKGYSYVVDSNELTEPDNRIELSNNRITIPTSIATRYLHIAAIDNAGNMSDTLHYKIKDTSVVNPTKPTIVSPSNNAFIEEAHSFLVKWTYKCPPDINGNTLNQTKALVEIEEENGRDRWTKEIIGDSTTATFDSIPKGRYNINITVHNETGGFANSDTTQIRIGVYSANGNVITKDIVPQRAIKFLSIETEYTLPQDTSLEGYIYYANNKNEFSKNIKIPFNLCSKNTMEIIRLPEKTSKIKIEYILRGSTISEPVTISPELDLIRVLAK